LAQGSQHLHHHLGAVCLHKTNYNNMARVMNVVTLGLAVLAGCMASTGPVEDALALADQAMTSFTQEKEAAKPTILAQDDKDADDGEQASAEQVIDEAAEPEDADAKVDPELAYAQKNKETQAHASMVEKVDEEAKPTTEAQVAVDAKNAHTAANTAKQAATVATKVAKHSLAVSENAKGALKNAHDALHKARVTTAGLTKGQKNSLKKAEKKLKEATKDAEYGQVQEAKYAKVAVQNKKLENLSKKMAAQKKLQDAEAAAAAQTQGELAAMNKDLESLRKKLKAQGGRDLDDQTIKGLQKQIKEMEKAEKKEDKADLKSHDEMKVEVERLRDMVKDLEKSALDDKATAAAAATVAAAKEAKEKAAAAAAAAAAAEAEASAAEAAAVAAGLEKPKKTTKAKTHALPKPVKSPDSDVDYATGAAAVGYPQAKVKGNSIDIDTAMPYGDLEPFGREDTAQELTESSINESNEMVDQLEKAEVAEEKRAVFRALTRLRGAAITSFDGVARSQTGNIDEYNKIHQWRATHPLHHLADEESDVGKWAFPDNAD